MSKHTPEFIQSQLSFDEIPYGYCHCGCGQLAPIAKVTRLDYGHIKGQPIRFINHHFNRMMRPMEDRFWAMVDKRGPDECWIWQGTYSLDGVGRFRIGGSKGYTALATRVSWEIHNGPIPNDKEVCHSCDANYPAGDITYRRCVNPAHLWLGSHLENMVDMKKKGRGKDRQQGWQGEKHPQAKLTTANVLKIRDMFSRSISQTEIAKQFDVSISAVNYIVHRKTWRHVP